MSAEMTPRWAVDGPEGGYAWLEVPRAVRRSQCVRMVLRGVVVGAGVVVCVAGLVMVLPLGVALWVLALKLDRPDMARHLTGSAEVCRPDLLTLRLWRATEPMTEMWWIVADAGNCVFRWVDRGPESRARVWWGTPDNPAMSVDPATMRAGGETGRQAVARLRAAYPEVLVTRVNGRDM